VPHGILRVLDLGEHDQEFVPTLTTHGVRAANRSLQPLADCLQELAGRGAGATLKPGLPLA